MITEGIADHSGFHKHPSLLARPGQKELRRRVARSDSIASVAGATCAVIWTEVGARVTPDVDARRRGIALV